MFLNLLKLDIHFEFLNLCDELPLLVLTHLAEFFLLLSVQGHLLDHCIIPTVGCALLPQSVSPYLIHILKVLLDLFSLHLPSFYFFHFFELLSGLFETLLLFSVFLLDSFQLETAFLVLSLDGFYEVGCGKLPQSELRWGSWGFRRLFHMNRGEWSQILLFLAFLALGCG